MTPQEHMNKVALQYAGALARWHATRDPVDHTAMTALQDKLNDAAIECAFELIEE
jgi:hypothetical protein